MIDLIAKLLGSIDTKAGRVLSLLMVAALAILGILLPAQPSPLAGGQGGELPAESAAFEGAFDAVPTAVASNASSFTAVVANDLEALDDLFVGDDASIADDLAVTGTLAVAGAINFLVDATIITTDTTYTAADSGTLVAFKNQDTFQVTAILPAAAAGLNFCFYNYDGDDVQVDVPTADQIHHYTNATADEVDNTTAGDWICLTAVDATDWVAYSIEGTWSDD